VAKRGVVSAARGGVANMTNFAQERVILTALEKVFSAAASERDSRPLDLEDPDISGWVLHEREVMHAEVCRLRAQLGKGPVSIDRIRKVECVATGHVDYQHKFCLYCRDLVLEG
jgi:hypothetical protein